MLQIYWICRSKLKEKRIYYCILLQWNCTIVLSTSLHPGYTNKCFATFSQMCYDTLWSANNHSSNRHYQTFAKRPWWSNYNAFIKSMFSKKL